MNKDRELEDLLQFLDQSPTAWHAIHNVMEKLHQHDFQELPEKETWKIQLNQRYFVVRNGSSLCAFVTPKETPKRVRLLASHTDSPAFKLKPQPEIRKQNMILFGVEIYGAPLLSSWLNRDLGLAGRVIYLDQAGHIKEQLVNLHQFPLVIPQIAIHLDREVNEKGLLLNRQEHLNALAALDEGNEKSGNYLELLLKNAFEFESILNFDLFLYPLEKARFIGHGRQMIASYRIDSLASVHAILTAFSTHLTPLDQDLKMIVLWDNEEIGSSTAQGASSPFLMETLERILLQFNKGREDYFCFLNQSHCLSLDLAHALHPNYTDKHDPQHQPLLGKGAILKTSAQQRYASDARSSFPIQAIAHQHQIPLQKFVSRNDIPAGTTIGPIQATLTGMKTVDMGCGQLSMHSSRELMSCQDHLSLCRLLKEALNTASWPILE